VRNLKGYWICKKSITRTKYTSNRATIHLFTNNNKCTCTGNRFKRISIHISSTSINEFPERFGFAGIIYISLVMRDRYQLSITSGLTVLFSGFKSYNLINSSLKIYTEIFREYATEYHFSQKEITDTFTESLNH